MQHVHMRSEDQSQIYRFFALASCAAKSCTGQYSEEWSVFELRWLASNKILIESFFL